MIITIILGCISIVLWLYYVYKNKKAEKQKKEFEECMRKHEELQNKLISYGIIARK